MGGRWSRWRRAHVFESDPRQAIAPVLDGDGVPGSARAREGFVATPDALARHVVVTYSGLSPDSSARVLEPSAGGGALVRAVLAHAPSSTVVAVEPNPDRARAIDRHPAVTVHLDTVEHYAATAPAGFDTVVMNPPYSTADNPSLWIDHLHLGWQLLAPGGRLVAIVPTSVTFRQDRRHRAAREPIESFGGFRELAADAFIPADSAIGAVAVWMSRPTLRR